MAIHSSEPLKLFYCYAHEDKMLRDELDAHLSLMKRQGLVTVWYDREILAGTSWEHEIDTHLTSADIILLLVSARFLASDYCFGIEMKRALQRDKAGTSRVVPILLRPVDWEDAPFSHLQILPAEAKPVTRWSDPNDAFEDIAKALRKVVKDLRASLKMKEERLKEAIALEKSKRYEEALVAYDQVIQSDSNYAIAYNNKGVVLSILNRYEEAFVVYDHAIQLNSTYALAYNNKGIALNILNRYEEALAAYDQAIRHNPGNAQFYNNKGDTLYNLQRYEEALVTYEQAIKLNPYYAEAYHSRGDALNRMNRWNEALTAFAKAKQLGYQM